jgi:hypothetical protein
MPGGGGMLCWRSGGIDWKQYSKVMFERIQIYLKPGSSQPVDPTDLNSVWQVALIDLPNPPRLEPMLRAQGGYADKIGGKNVVLPRRLQVLRVQRCRTVLSGRSARCGGRKARRVHAVP